MTLGEMIERLKNLPSTDVFESGWRNPHSYRGDYVMLAFEPAENVTVYDMLSEARYAEGRFFPGWKGGEFRMSGYTDVFIAKVGECGRPLTSEVFELHALRQARRTDVALAYCRGLNTAVTALIFATPPPGMEPGAQYQWEKCRNFCVLEVQHQLTSALKSQERTKESE